MKKLISISLVLVLAGGLILAENKRAEAIDPGTAAFIATTFFLLPVLSAISYEHNHYRPASYYPGTYPASNYYGAYPAANYYGAYYSAPYPARTRVYYSAPRYDGYYGRNLNRGYGYVSDYRSHRGYNKDRHVNYAGRDRYDGRDLYAGRYNRDRY
jgi:hypothetical protein